MRTKGMVFLGTIDARVTNAGGIESTPASGVLVVQGSVNLDIVATPDFRISSWNGSD